VTSEGSRERAEREILLPWVRHMWDTFRNVMDNLRYTPKLEHVYHAVAVKAMRLLQGLQPRPRVPQALPHAARPPPVLPAAARARCAAGSQR